jgi:hypothetical protein
VFLHGVVVAEFDFNTRRNSFDEDFAVVIDRPAGSFGLVGTGVGPR